MRRSLVHRASELLAADRAVRIARRNSVACNVLPPLGATTMPALRDLISGWTNGGSVHGAAIVSEDGLLVHDALDPGTDREAIAALAIELVRNGRQLGLAGARSGLHTVVLELEHGPAILSPLDASHTLIVFAAGDTDIGPLLYEIRTQRAAVSAAI